jgi:hypothetical protein
MGERADGPATRHTHRFYDSKIKILNFIGPQNGETTGGNHLIFVRGLRGSAATTHTKNPTFIDVVRSVRDVRPFKKRLKI